jgi:hypothetical protein
MINRAVDLADLFGLPMVDDAMRQLAAAPDLAAKTT